MKKNRRNFLKTMSVLPLIPAISYSNDWTANPEAINTIPGINLPQIGAIRKKTPKDFSRSPFGIGCETLDRELWDPKEIYPWMDDLPVKWARLQTGWARVEREKGRYDWGWLDESVDGLLERGFKPFFNVGYGNTLYTEGDMGFHPLISDEAYAAWKKFVRALARRYKNKILYYEIWNEPNLKGFWKPGEVDPAKYVKIVRDTGQIIRKNCPGAVIIGGVLSRLPFNFIRSMFEEGLAKEIDIFSFHPYGVIPEQYAERIMTLRKYIDLYDPSIKIWQGEMGYPSDSGSSGFSGEPPWTETIQAKIMLRRLLTDISLGLDMSLWFLIVDLHDYPKGSGNVNYKGILRVEPKIAHKLAFPVLQNLGSTIYGDVSVRVALTRCMESSGKSAEELVKTYSLSTGQSMNKVYSAMLNTGGGKVLAWWETVKATDTYDTKNIDLILWDYEGNGFEDPVLVDLMSGKIFDLGSSQKRVSDGSWQHMTQVFQQLPLHDYPVLIMEKKMAMS